MTGPDVLFSIIVVVGFVASALDHHFYGKREFHRPVRALYLGCVIAIDLWLALTVNPFLALWVLLYVYGLWNVFRV